jgi:hypothetical protein
MTTLDEQIEELQQELQIRKDALKETKKASKMSWKTNGDFVTGFSDSVYHVQTADIIRVKLCVKVLIGAKRTHEEVNEALGLPEEEFLYCGYSFDDWMHDFKKRLSIISIKEQESKLKALEDQLSEILSEDTKRKLKFEAIKNALKD